MPGLGTVLVGDDPGSHWYVGAKHKDCAEIGITSIRRDLPADSHPGGGRGGHRRAQRRPGVHGLPGAAADRLDEFALLSRVDPDKDVDGLHPFNLGKLVLGESGPLPCTPVGIIELLRRHDVPIAGAEVVVVGRGLTVGRPLGLLLTRRSENATVTLCHTGTRDLASHVRTADIVVAAAGVPGIITGDMVKPGAAVLDVGVSRVEGKIAGDVAAEVWDVAGWVSPEPGRGRADDPSHAAGEHRRRWPRSHARVTARAMTDEDRPPEPLPDEEALGPTAALPVDDRRAALPRGAGRDGCRDRHRLAVRATGASACSGSAAALSCRRRLRLVLRAAEAGMLAVRHRAVDASSWSASACS